MQLTNTVLVFCVGWLVVAGSVVAQPASDTEERLAQFQAELNRIREANGVPALWAGKFQIDGRQLLAASGVRKWNASTVVQPHDVVHIGSCTKAMTAFLIAQQCATGELDWDSKLKEIFPTELALAASNWGDVSVRDLLQHRSGATANADWWQLQEQHPHDSAAARRALLRWLVQQKPPRESRFIYSNVGYALLGHIVEHQTKQSWEQLLQKRLFHPLAMKSAGFGPISASTDEREATDAPQVAWGHNWTPSTTERTSSSVSEPGNYEPVQIDNAPPLGPAGRVHLSLEDWAKFALLFCHDASREKLNVTAAAEKSLLTTTTDDQYAGGWQLLEREWAGGRVLHHNGSNTTWSAVAFVAPEKGFCLLAATNCASPTAAPACDAAVQALLRLNKQ